MDGLGKERSICSSRPFPWLNHTETETSSRLWNLTLTDCFSSYEKPTPYSDKQNEYMDGRKKPVLELKDVPPPPRHTSSSSSSSQPFPLAPLPPAPCLQPPPPLPVPQQHDPPLQHQQGGSPKVSVCAHCEASLRHCGTFGGYGLHSGGTSGVPLYMPPSSLSQAPSNTSRAGTCSMPCGGGGGGVGVGAMDPLGDALNTLRSPGGYKLQMPPHSVATSQPLSSSSSSSLSQAHPHLPCCAQGLLRPSAYPPPPPPVPYGLANLPPPPSDPLLLLPAAAALPLCGCRASAGYYPCGVDCSPAAGSRRAAATHGDPHHSPHHHYHHHHPPTTTSSSSQSHLCSHPMHLNVECTVCLKGAHYCRECLTKPAASEPERQTTCWPGVPPPAPMCNGCGGSSSDAAALLPGSGLAKAGQKYGGPEGAPPESAAPPPVGVFWDIENCCVPSGRSAAAVVQRLRARFFQGHREAEFMCVCDISKENKAVIQELNNCQVTVAHINATAKNAADDKLRQSLRRFAETHAAPATVVLVSSDVNFASELSDLRHRHGFQVILVHNSEASPALLQHAHRHVTFQEITASLPPRMAVKSQPSFNLLYVHNLPTNRDAKSVGARLRRLSDNCGGKVLGVSSGAAVLRFGSQEAAERARRRMDNEDVYGRRISLSFSPRPPPGCGGEEGGPPPPPPASSSALPLLHQHRQNPAPPPPPTTTNTTAFAPFVPLELPRLLRRSRRPARVWHGQQGVARDYYPPASTSASVPERPYSPRRGCSGPPGGAGPPWPQQEPGGGPETKPKMGFHLEKGRASSSSPHGGGGGAGGDSAQQQQLLLQQLPKPGLVGESMYSRRGSTPRSASDSPAPEQQQQQQRVGERGSGEFQVSTPSAFSKLSLHRSFSPTVLFQGSWSPRSASPCLSSRSSPLLTAPRSPLTLPPSPLPHGPAQPFSDGADVQVANLDYRMSRKELQQILQDTFSRHGRVKGVELSPHTDYQLKATVQLGSLQQAISAVSGLHRHKIGGKRIHVSLITGGNNKSLAMLSSEVVAALQDTPAGCLPLFKFTEIYEKKYGRKLVASDLYRLPEVVSVREQGGARMVCLLPSGQARLSPLCSSSPSQESAGSSSSTSPVVFEELEYHEPVCPHHYPQNGFSEADFDPDSYKIPFVVASLNSLSPQVHSLVQSHDGTLPLLSFPECFASEFSPLQLAEEGQVEGAVPLEHLITCVPGITIVTAQNGFKIIKWTHNKPPAPNTDPWVQRCRSPVGNPQLIQFSREVVDLMKSRPACAMPVGKFIPAYHHHFAKQCRVSDYGYSKLLELLEAVPHVLQILGMGSKRLLTLTHRAQVKRFTQDLLKLLKFQVSKQVAIQDFMQAYHWCFSRDWRVVDYGMCDLLDLLAEIPDTTVTVTRQDDDTVISVPKRERTAEEVERTRQFGKEVVDLLRHQPHCTMPFSKFIPTYHHHFGRQCKLTYYGFSKLMELFEAIPDVLVVLECGEDKVLTLTEVERVKALAAQLVKLLRAQRGGGGGGCDSPSSSSSSSSTSSSLGLPANKLLSEYSKTFGYALRLQDYDACSLPSLLAKLRHVVKVVEGPCGREVQLINRKSLRQLTGQLLSLLMAPGEEGEEEEGRRREWRGRGEEEERDSVSVGELSAMYRRAYGVALSPCEYGFLSLSELLKSLPYLVELFYEEEEGEEGGRGEERVRLTRLYRFARAVRALLHTYHYHQIFLTEFPAAYSKFTGGGGLQPRAYGYSSTDELLCAIPQVVWIKGHGHKRIIVLKNDMKVRSNSAASNSPQPEEEEEEEEDGERQRDSPSSNPESGTPSPAPTEAELLRLSSPLDLLGGPAPSCLPSPQLRPDPVLLLLRQADLIRFEERMPTPTEGHGCEETAEGPMLGAPPPAQDASRPTDVAQPPQRRVEANPTDAPAKRAPRNKVKLAANFCFAGAR